MKILHAINVILQVRCAGKFFSNLKYWNISLYLCVSECVWQLSWTLNLKKFLNRHHQMCTVQIFVSLEKSRSSVLYKHPAALFLCFALLCLQMDTCGSLMLLMIIQRLQSFLLCTRKKKYRSGLGGSILKQDATKILNYS